MWSQMECRLGRDKTRTWLEFRSQTLPKQNVVIFVFSKHTYANLRYIFTCFVN